jgi:tRNA-dependent cyclodipeptide synthase
MSFKIINKLNQNNNNLFIGISIGKKISKANLIKCIDYSVNNFNGEIAILVADEISKINNKVVNGYSTGKAIKKAFEDGDKYINLLTDIINDNFKENNNIHIIRWKDINTKQIKSMKNILENELLTNNSFKNEIFFFISEYVKKRHNRKILSKDKLYELSEYILLELPTLLKGITYNKIKYLNFLYPTYKETTMSKLVLDIFLNKKYKEIKEKLKLEKPINLIEYYID